MGVWWVGPGSWTSAVRGIAPQRFVPCHTIFPSDTLVAGKSVYDYMNLEPPQSVLHKIAKYFFQAIDMYWTFKECEPECTRREGSPLFALEFC